MALCSRLQAAIPKLLDDAPADVLIITASWKTHHDHDPAGFREAVLQTFPRYKKWAKKVVVVGAPAAARIAVPDAMARANAFGRTVDLRGSQSYFDDLSEVNRFVADQSKINGYAFIDLKSYLCGRDCQPYAHGQPLFFDNGHIRAKTSIAFARKFSGVFFPLPARP